jgi:hypothetical protein
MKILNRIFESVLHDSITDPDVRYLYMSFKKEIYEMIMMMHMENDDFNEKNILQAIKMVINDLERNFSEDDYSGNKITD